MLVRSDSMMVVAYINRHGGLTSKRLFEMVRRLLDWAHLKLRSLRAAHVPGMLNQRADMSPQTSGCSTHKRFRKSWRSLARQRSTSLPQNTTLTIELIFRRARMRWPRNGWEPPLIRFSPDHSDPPGNQARQGTQTQSAICGPTLDKPSLDLRAVSAAYSSNVGWISSLRGTIRFCTLSRNCGLYMCGFSTGIGRSPREFPKYYLTG